MAAPSMVIERERKYEIVPGSGVPRLLGVAGVETQDDPVEQVLDASYYDTRTYRLAQAGITLRRRVGGHDAGWHVKLPVSADERREIQLPLGGDAHKVPGRLKRLVRAYTLGEKLVPIAHLRTDRFAHRLADAEGRTVAVLTDDHVTGEAGRRVRAARRVAGAGTGARPRHGAGPAGRVRPGAGRGRCDRVAVAVEAAAPDRRPRARTAPRPQEARRRGRRADVPARALRRPAPRGRRRPAGRRGLRAPDARGEPEAPQRPAHLRVHCGRTGDGAGRRRAEVARPRAGSRPATPRSRRTGWASSWTACRRSWCSDRCAST